MQTIQNTTMGFELPVNMPSSVEEFDKMAGTSGACLNGANQQYLQHSWNSDFRRNFVKKLEESTGIKRKVDAEKTAKQPERKDGTRAEVYEQEAVYFKRVLAESGKSKDEFFNLALEVANATPVDLSEGSRGGGRLAKEYIQAAQQLLGKVSAGTASLDAIVNQLQTKNPGLTITRGEDGSVKEDDLARAIKVNSDRKRREELEELGLTASTESNGGDGEGEQE